MTQPDNTLNVLSILIPLVVVVIGLSQLILSIMKRSDLKRESLLDMIEKLRIEMGEIKSHVSQLTADNQELLKDNEELRKNNLLWRKVARKWYAIAITFNKELASMADDGLDEPTDL